MPRPAPRSHRLTRSAIPVLTALATVLASFSALQPQAGEPNSKVIVFSSERNTRGRDLYSMDSSGGSLKKLTDYKGTSHEPHCNSPKISPDGTKIVYHADTDGHDRYSVWVMNIDGSNPVRMTMTEGMFPNWSADGKTLFFSGRQDRVWELFSIPATGGKQNNLSRNREKGIAPGWASTCTTSSDGATLFCTPIREKTLLRMSADGSNVQEIGKAKTAYSQPIVSRDGSRLAVMRRENESYEVITMSLRGDNIRVHADNAISYSSLAWSPDGSELLFGGAANGHQQIFKVHLETGKETQLTDNSVFDAMPSW